MWQCHTESPTSLMICSGLCIDRRSRFCKKQHSSCFATSRNFWIDNSTPTTERKHSSMCVRRIEYKILSHTYRAIHHQSPVYLSDLLSVYRPTRSLRSESTTMLTVQRTRTVTFGDRPFTKAAATLWNSLPVNIRNSDTCIKFQRQLKTFLFRQQYVDNKLTYQPF